MTTTGTAMPSGARAAWVARAILLLFALPAFHGAAVAGGAVAPSAPATQEAAKTPVAVKPTFASLKASEVNLRKGPGMDYPIAWVFRRAGLPVKVTREFEGWREVTDSEGTTGWIIRGLLSARRTAQVMPWQVSAGEARQQEPLTERPRDGAKAVALVEAGVIADIQSCDGTWCNVMVGDFQGYIRQERLWGVDKGEVIE